MRTEISKLKSTSKYPTSVIVRGLDYLGIELVNSLIEQGGYVVMIDSPSEEGLKKLENIKDPDLFTFLDFTALPHLEDDLRRLDYVFFFNHQSTNLDAEISTQEFLEISNYLNSVLDLSAKFEAKFLLTTSVSAHRQIVGHQDMILNFSPENAKKHSVYSEVEVQRYAESLTMEYEEKASLNTRIVRLGEIIGEGIEFNEESELTRLIFAAVDGEPLAIHGDGLEEEFYVNGQDAVYGLLKAQFSQDTKGKIFTLANEDSVTALSLAYKIQELEPRAGEIQFVDKKMDPYLRLYKPATNLSNIGWRPKVNFERSLAQSIELSYDFLKIKKETEQFQENASSGNFADKLKNFFFVADDIEKLDANDPQYGALSRLIAERKQQENTRRGSIVLANDKLRERVKGQTPVPTTRKFRNSVYKFFNKIKPDVAGINRISLDQFILYLILFIIGAVIYFGLISPVLSFGKDMYIGYENLKKANDSFAAANLNDMEKYVKSSKEHFELAGKTLTRFEVFFDITNQEDFYKSVSGTVKSANLYTDGLSLSLTALRPMYDYIHNFNDEVFYRPNSEDTLIFETGQDYSGYFAELEAKEGELSNGIGKIETATSTLKSINTESFPAILREEIAKSISSSEEAVTSLKSINGYLDDFSEVFGAEGTKTYLILLHDNTRYNPTGGALNSYALITLSDGSIKDIEVNEVSALELKFDNLSAQTLEQINLISFSQITNQNSTLADFQLIPDYDHYTDEIIKRFETSLNKDVDGLISLNLNSLDAIIKAYGSVTVEQYVFTGENTSSNLDLVGNDNEEKGRREEVINQVFAQVIQKILNESDEKSDHLGSVIESQAEQKNIIFSFKGMDFQRFLSNKNWTAISYNNTDFIKTYVISKRTEFNQSEFPILNVSVDATLTNNLTTVKKLNIAPKNLDDLDYVAFCIPAGAINLDFGGVNPLLYNQNFDSENECVSVKFNQIDELSVTFNTLPFENLEGSVYNYNFVLQNNPGVEIIYDYNISFDSTLTPTNYHKSGFLDGNQLVYAGNKLGDLILDLTLNKNE